MYLSDIFNEKTIQTLGKINLIGQGSYGCVISPPIITEYSKVYIENNNLSNDDVAKCFREGYQDDFKKELKILKGINNLDPDGTFTVKLKGANAFPETLLLSQGSDVIKCLDISERTWKKPLLIYQIILENAGKEIEKLAKYSIDYDKFIEMLYIFLNGIKKMHSAKLIHQDIKPTNVMMSDNKIYLIDFGISEDASKVYSKENYNTLSYLYTYYPPEFYIASILLKYRNDKERFQIKLDTVIEILQKEYLNIIFKENKIYSIINDIQDFINEMKLNDYSYHDVFNENMAYKCDIYSLSFVINEFANKLIYQNESQKIIVFNLYKMCSKINPFQRATIDELLEYIDKSKNITKIYGGRKDKKMRRLVIPKIYNKNNNSINVHKKKVPFILKI